MKTLLLKCIVLAAVFFLASCQPIPMTQSICLQRAQDGQAVAETNDRVVEWLESRVADGRHVQKIENLIVLVDDSSRLLVCQGPDLMRQRAYDLIESINSTLAGIQLNKVIRIFGPEADRTSFTTTTVYGMAGSETAHLKPSVITITPDDPMLNPLTMALESTYQELKDVKGNTAVLLLSDFERLDSEVYATLDMFSQYYDDRVCLYGIFLGDDVMHEDFLKKILGVNFCGFFSKETALADPVTLADFLEKVVFDIIAAPEPMESVSVPQPQAPLVEKVEPKSPIQEKAKPVEPKKAELSYAKLQVEKELRIELKTQFDLDRSVIRPEDIGQLQAIADFMKKYSDTTTAIEGHTCNLGTAEYNLKLSQQRADAVKKYLVETLGVDADRIGTRAYGETRPVADNSTEEGRKQNRRAVAVITTTVLEDVEANKQKTGSASDSVPTDDERFTKIDADTILDNQTGLMWASHDNGQDIGWLDAKRYCEEYRGGGFADWRMATEKELQTLYVEGKKNSAGYFITELISLTNCCLWSTDVSMNSAWIFSFKTGNRPWGYQADTYQLRALPVRTAN
jgi:OOP family OmpA-OmpF porin